MSVFASASPALREAIAALLRHRLALIALAAFMVAGIVISNDIGMSPDRPYLRYSGIANLAYIAGDTGIFPEDHNKFYGAVFDAPLVFIERALGLEDSRDIYVSYFLATHLFYLIGGLFAYFLARRLFDNKVLALFAMLLFLLHPRVHAAAFANSKDIPFISMFMITLFLAHRAFRKDMLLAFALLGLGAGILINIRIMGVVLLAGVLGMQAALLFSRAHQRKRVLLNGGALVLAAGLVVYASLPYLWADPAPRAVEWWTTLAYLPHDLTELFRGRVIHSQAMPVDYVPTWFSITSPPFALLLGAIGVIALLVRWAGIRRQALRDRKLRFEALITGCFATPLIAIAILNPVVYSGWTHVYFLWAPFSLLATFGLGWLLKQFPPARLRTMACGAAAAGLGTTLITMTLLHPLSSFYFNFLVDRTTPEHLNSQYRAQTTNAGVYTAMKRLTDLRPSSSVALRHNVKWATNRLIFPEDSRNRLIPEHESIAEFSIKRVSGTPDRNTLIAVRVYDSTLWAVAREEPGENRYASVYEATVSGVPAARSEYDVYVNHADRSLVYVKEPCAAPVTKDVFFLQVFPDNSDDLPIEEQSLGRANEEFRFYDFGSAFDGKCVAEAPLPEYGVAGIRTGQLRGLGGDDSLWEAALPYEDASVYRAAYHAAVAAEPVLRAEFDLYVSDDPRALIYTREPCALSDVENPFFIHVTPERESDLPTGTAGTGFDNWGFDFLLRGVVFDGKCVARAPLPDYPIASIRTGQWIRGEGEVWEAALPYEDASVYRAAYHAAVAAEPVLRAEFDLYVSDDPRALIYTREPCALSDVENPFFIHVTPERESDLPTGTAGTGFDNWGFDFLLRGVVFDGKCVARAPLPDYPIASIRTGQWIRGEGEVWEATLSLSP